MDFYWAVRKTLLESGRENDQQQKLAWSFEVGDGRLREGFRASGVPHVELDLLDRFVAHKPAGWEVDSKHLDTAKPDHLSRYLQRVLGSPLSYDVMRSCGLLHRFDIPSSGLVLVAKTCEAYYDLQLPIERWSFRP